MFAGVVTSFDSAPRYSRFTAPEASSEHDLVVNVLAAGLHPRVRSQASGSHYTSTDELPLIPGVDGVGRGADGLLRYFVLSDTTFGSMAEQTVIDTRRSVVLPDDSDPVAVAAAMNPAMSSWVALRQRISFSAGQNVLVLAATGSAGRIAVQVAKHFGAGQIVAVGRDAERLDALTHLGATDTVLLEGTPDDIAERIGRASTETDVVLDYLWGEPMAAALTAVVSNRADESRLLSWIEIGSVAGPVAPIPSAALRSCRLQIVGSGQGSVSPREIVAELPALAAAITDGTFDLTTRTYALSDIETAWADFEHTSERIVITPNS
ncbi:quinone oxidoreductase family protein [Subtercola lobariae]|uniref:NADPH:quinone reductase n=1 Tax=Subtercola lobariae TaxID=1588641 RepID=A0A917BDW9_9MICO|nr:zinc-binding alcohol dehydrogenase family protein [Subtercola lobariae]GGF39341.1 NADPH:quinone reductase [Subtercola lobariae]